jgi:uncharacterized surface protein with fasciclin (FAS1) repeats
MKTRFVQFVATAAVFGLFIGLARPATTIAGSGKDIVDTAVEAGSFNTLAKALTEAGLVATLKGPGPYTTAAPRRRATW